MHTNGCASKLPRGKLTFWYHGSPLTDNFLQSCASFRYLRYNISECASGLHGKHWRANIKVSWERLCILRLRNNYKYAHKYSWVLLKNHSKITHCLRNFLQVAYWCWVGKKHYVHLSTNLNNYVASQAAFWEKKYDFLLHQKFTKLVINTPPTQGSDKVILRNLEAFDKRALRK